MDQPLDLVGFHSLQCGERAELGQLGDLAFHQLSLAELLGNRLPWVGLELAHRQADAFAFRVHPQHLDLHFLPDLEQVLRVGDPPPGDLRQVHQAVRPADVDEGAEIGQADDVSAADLSRLEFGDQVLLEHLARLARRRPLREDQPVAPPIDLDHLGHDRLPDHLAPAFIGRLALGATPPRQAHLRGGDESAQVAELDDQAALVVAGHLAVQRLLAFQQALGIRPVALLFGARQREDQPVLPPAGADDIHADLRPHRQRLAYLRRQLFEFSGRDDSLRLRPDVHQDISVGNAGDRAATYLASAGGLQVQRLPTKECVHRIHLRRPFFLGLAGLGPDGLRILLHERRLLRIRMRGL